MASLIHVTYREKDGMWHVVKNNRSTESFKTQKEAIAAGKKYATEASASLEIHGKDGRIQRGYDYNTPQTRSSGKTQKKNSK